MLDLKLLVQHGSARLEVNPLRLTLLALPANDGNDDWSA